MEEIDDISQRGETQEDLEYLYADEDNFPNVDSMGDYSGIISDEGHVDQVTSIASAFRKTDRKSVV